MSAAGLLAALGIAPNPHMDPLDQVNELLARGGLTPREEKVLRMRHGIMPPLDETLGGVGQDFDVTRERIRQIEAKALRKASKKR